MWARKNLLSRCSAPSSGAHDRHRGYVASLTRRSAAACRDAPRHSNIPPPTLEERRQAAPWLWVNCRNSACLHQAPLAIMPLIIRWGPDASSNQLRQNARCKKCGKRGADLQHPSARNSDLTPSPTTREQRIGLVCLS